MIFWVCFLFPVSGQYQVYWNVTVVLDCFLDKMDENIASKHQIGLYKFALSPHLYAKGVAKELELSYFHVCDISASSSRILNSSEHWFLWEVGDLTEREKERDMFIFIIITM